MDKKAEQEFLNNYNADKYEKPSATVDMLIFTIGEKEKSYRELPEKNLELLLIKRKGFPYKDMWAIPGGFIDIHEDLYESAKRELKEETNLENIYMEQLYTWGETDRDPRTRVLSTSYMALVPKEKLNIMAGDDAAEAKLFSVKLVELYSSDIIENDEMVGLETVYELVLKNNDKTAISKVKVTKKLVGTSIEETYDVIDNGMAFDHAKIIVYAINRLRNKIEYTTVAFNLINKEFTIGELQSVYSTILDQNFAAPNFRRKMLPMLEEVDRVEEEKGHRPAKYYRLSKKFVFGKKNFE